MTRNEKFRVGDEVLFTVLPHGEIYGLIDWIEGSQALVTLANGAERWVGLNRLSRYRGY